jgi:signal transduction histidine kinase
VPRRVSTDRAVLALATLLLGGVALAVPAGFYVLSVRHAQGGLEAEVEVVAREVSAVVTSNPELWRFEQVRLEELLQRRLRGGEPAVRRVLDGQGRVVVESADPLSAPVVRRSAPVLDAGVEVGRVEVLHSVRPAAARAALLAALLLPLAAAALLGARRHLARQALERLGLERRLRQGQRLEAIGHLAGGVAHDFNNLLAAVLGYARELREELPAGAPQQEAVGEILAVAQRGVQVTRSLLAFSRRQSLALERLDAGELVRGLEKLLRSTLGPGMELRLQLDAAPLPVLVDRVQVELVLVNLVANARDAMRPGGILRVVTAPVTLGAAAADALGLAGPGTYARLDVADSGAGMDEPTRERIFDPFFTTKPAGRGTGLGLALAHGVVQQHAGAIQVTSAPGQGTTFTLLFPGAATQPPAAPTPEGAADGPTPGGGETVLVAEDDRHVRRVVRRLLQRAGYTVVEAADGDEAVRRFAEHQREVRLVLLDVHLPGRSGPEALDEIRGLARDLPVVFVSGNPGDGEAGEHQVLLKPVDPGALLRAVRRAIDG